jgi:hypothetical protein
MTRFNISASWYPLGAFIVLCPVVLVAVFLHHPSGDKSISFGFQQSSEIGKKQSIWKRWLQGKEPIPSADLEQQDFATIKPTEHIYQMPDISRPYPSKSPHYQNLQAPIYGGGAAQSYQSPLSREA